MSYLRSPPHIRRKRHCLLPRKVNCRFLPFPNWDKNLISGGCRSAWPAGHETINLGPPGVHLLEAFRVTEVPEVPWSRDSSSQPSMGPIRPWRRDEYRQRMMMRCTRDGLVGGYYWSSAWQKGHLFCFSAPPRWRPDRQAHTVLSSHPGSGMWTERG